MRAPTTFFALLLVAGCHPKDPSWATSSVEHRGEPTIAGEPLAVGKLESAPVLDGKLDDAAWSKAEPTDAFVQKFPNEGQPATEKTTLRIVYDDEAVYVGFDCEQTRARVVQRLTRRGRLVESDWVSIAFGTRGDGKTAFEFLVNAAGVRVDALRFNDTEKTDDRDEN